MRLTVLGGCGAWPRADPEAARVAVAAEYDGAIGVAAADLVLDLP